MSGTPRLILASASPRRRELLARLGLPFTVEPSNVDETAPPASVRAERVARRLARAKALDLARRHPEAAVLAADTIVVLRGRLLGKPGSADEAAATLRALRGRWHRVITGVALAHGRRVRVDHAITRVRMRPYTDEEITRYIASGDPFDKAGAYAIQDAAFRPVACCDGCYCNVVGLPLAVVIDLLRRAGFAVPNDRPANLLPECCRCPLFTPAGERHAARDS